MKSKFLGFEYFNDMKSNHPELYSKSDSPLSYIMTLSNWFATMKLDSDPERFCSIKRRGFSSNFNVTRMTRNSGLEWQSASQTYKGLLNFKTPFDLQLYSSLIWELRPATIIEFGSMQGGSALWFSDQLKSAGIDGFVHSFDLVSSAVHNTAKDNDRILFHNIDLNNADEIDEDFFLKLPRPWLVVDDAHVNMKNLIPKISKLLKAGDYYILEDIFLHSFYTHIDKISELTEVIDKSGLVVDTKYTDAFGYNVTLAPNGWLTKT